MKNRNFIFNFVTYLKFTRRKLLTKYFTTKVKKNAHTCGTSLKVNYKSNVTLNTFLGNNVNFNGMRIQG